MRWLKRIFKWIAIGLGLVVLVFVVLCFVPHRGTVPPIQPRPNTEYWTMSKGYDIAFTRVPALNTEGKSPIIFLHGGPGGYVYTSTIETMGRFAELGHDVYLYDQVGSGLSDRVKPRDYSVLGNVEDLEEIVSKHIGVEQVILIGQSYGAILSAYFMALHPERVERAVMTSPGSLEPSQFVDGRWINLDKYPVPDHLEFVEPFDFAPLTFARRMKPRTLAALMLATVFNVKLMDDEEADAVLNDLIVKITPAVVCDPDNVHREEGGGGFYAHYLGNWYGDLEDPRPRLAKLATPVLVLQGQCDFIPYAGAYEYADLFPNGEYRFIEGAGHEIWWDRPDRFVEVIGRFLTAEPRKATM